MAGWSDWYSGDMAPPLRQPGGGYSPAPATQPQMSPEEIYQGIYGEPLQLTSRSVKSVPVPTQATTDARFGLGAGVRASGDAAYQSPKVFVPNALPGPDPVAKSQDRLPAMPAGLPLKSDVPGFASGRGSLGAGGFGNGSVTMSPRSPAAPVHQLNVDVPADEGQYYADSLGMPVRSKSGTVFQPKGGAKTPQQRIEAKGTLGARDTRGPLGQLLGMKGSGGLGGLLGGLFGGGQSRGGGLGGLLSGMGGGAQATRAPLAGHSMIVDPSTQAGSTLESMGFSSGGSVPAAVVENLSKRGYI